MIRYLFLFIIYSLLLTFLNGCGAGSNFNRAKKLEKNKYYVQAIEKYKTISRNYSKSKYAPESLYRAARLYQKELKVYPEGCKLYAELIYKFPEAGSWVRLAKRGIFDSPDYFPLEEDYLAVEGDSQTGGKNMRLEQYCSLVSTYTYSIVKKYYAGKKLATKIKRFYTKENYELRELSSLKSKSYTVLLSFPFDKMKSWKTTRDKNVLKMTIVDTNASVKVRAGRFTGCIKVREENPKLPGAYKYEYYAPGVGHVLTTIGSSKSKVEHRNTELISYKFSKK